MTTEPSGALGSRPNEQSTMQQMTGQTQEKAQQLVGQAQGQAQQVAEQARTRLREQLDQRSSQAAEQITTHASDLRSVSETLHEQGKEGPANAAGKLSDYTERLGGYLRERDSDALLADAEDFGRRQPWAVAAGGVVLGFAAARFLKASSNRRYASRPASSRSAPAPAESAPAPASAGGSVPPMSPVPPRPTAYPDAAAPAGGPRAPVEPSPVRTSGL
jgi:hypothetical protein